MRHMVRRLSLQPPPVYPLDHDIEQCEEFRATMVATRTRLLISSTKVPTTFTSSGAGRELHGPTNWLT